MTQEQVNPQQALARSQPGTMALSGAAADPFKLAAVFHKSGLFKDIRDEAQAVVKIVYGAELGLQPMQSMMGVYIVDGKPSLAAATIATLIKRSGRYTFRVTRHEPDLCEIVFYERAGTSWEAVGVSSFTLADAQAAGLAGKGPWKQYPRNMLWARALTNGARWYCADVFGGAVYTPEEFGAVVDEDGVPLPPEPAPLRPVDASFKARVEAAPRPAQPATVTEKTVAAIAQRAARKGIDEDAMAALLAEYGVETVWELSAGQARELYSRLGKMADVPAPASAEDAGGDGELFQGEMTL